MARAADDVIPVGVDHRDAVLQQRVVERTVEADDERVRGARGRRLEAPMVRVDAGALVGADLVVPREAGHQRPAVGVEEAVVDRDVDRDAGLQRVTDLAMRRQAALDARGVEQHREPTPRRVPQLRFHRQERARDLLTGVRPPNVHTTRGEPLAHRRREVHVEPENVPRDLRRGRVDLDAPASSPRS